jgi:hypothetical protein
MRAHLLGLPDGIGPSVATSTRHATVGTTSCPLQPGHPEMRLTVVEPVNVFIVS